MFSAGLIAQSGGLPREVVMSILSKGVSIPFAVEVAKSTTGFLPWPPPLWWLPALWARCWASGP